MDIGVPASEGDMVTWIPGMKDMTPEEVSTVKNGSLLCILMPLVPLCDSK
jgi:hypothetical protein